MTVAIKLQSLMCKNGDIIHFEIEKQPNLIIKQSIYANPLCGILYILILKNNQN